MFWLEIAVGAGGDDRITIDSSFPPMPATGTGAITINTYDGADTIIQEGPAVAFTISGGNGNDIFVGGSGDDRFRGGPGNDTFYGGRGADSLLGEAGRDQVSYADDGRTSGVRTSLEGGASGNPLFDGAGDSIGGVEDVVGTPYTDVLVGSSSNNIIYSRGGSDRIDGLGGNDTINVTGGPSWVDGGDGDDTVNVKNGAKDFVSCGAGNDIATIEGGEVFVPFAACETLKP